VTDRLRACVLILCLAAELSACDWGGESTTGSRSVSSEGTTSIAEAPTVESSLEGLTSLPARVRWSATTSLPPAQVKTVYFRVDGDRWWADSWPPYTFGVPGAYFPASWLSTLSNQYTDGRSRTHEFAIRVVTTTDDKWESEPVDVRTPEATRVRPPGSSGRYWFGYWTGQYVLLSAADIANPPPPGQYPSFRGFLVFRGNSLLLRRGKHDFAWEIVSGDRRRMRLGTPIFLAAESHADAGSSFDGFDEVLCAPDGPPATYTWSKSTGRIIYSYRGNDDYAQNLELQAVKDPCKPRKHLLEGVWEGVPID
jgi:hypothetical protein